MDFSFSQPPASSSKPAAAPTPAAPAPSQAASSPISSMTTPAPGFGSGGTGQTQGMYKAPQEKSLITKVLIGVFVLLVLVAAGLFAYAQIVKSGIETKKTELATLEARLSQFALQDIRKLSARLKAGNQLVKDQPFANTLLKVLEESVENSTIFTRLVLQNDVGNAAYTANLEGEAPDYKSIVQQIETFKREPYSKYISKIEVKNLRPEKTGNITFVISFVASIRGTLPNEITLNTRPAEIIESPMLDFSATTTDQNPALPPVPSLVPFGQPTP